MYPSTETGVSGKGLINVDICGNSVEIKEGEKACRYKYNTWYNVEIHMISLPNLGPYAIKNVEPTLSYGT
jgi:hypothetical protein